MKNESACPCWATGVYIWTDRCESHIVKHPHHFSTEELRKLVELLKEPDGWQRIDKVRLRRDQ